MAVNAVKMSLFKPVYLDQRVTLSPTEYRDAAPDLRAYLLKKIRTRLEGQCCQHGYVRPGSTQILARSMGQAEHGRFTADFLFLCKVRVLCFLPQAEQVVEARVLKTNKLGLYALLVDQGRIREAMRILVPKELHLGNEEFDGLEVGQGIRVKVLRSRFQANDPFIQAVGTYEGLAPSADAKNDDTAAEGLLQPAVAPTEAPAAGLLQSADALATAAIAAAEVAAA